MVFGSAQGKKRKLNEGQPFQVDGLIWTWKRDRSDTKINLP